jgi:predicted Zn-dependent peptidase
MSANLIWQRKILPNGLTVLLYPRQPANTAQLSVGVKFGSNQEQKGQAGSAHFLEHMLAGGSDQRIKQSRKVEDHGGILDFYTDREQVVGTMDVTPQNLPEAASILSELFFGEKFSAEKFEIERKIILNELAEVEDDPSVKIEELLLEKLYRKHPIMIPVGGYPKTVKKLTLQQLVDTHRINYVPQNMVLVLSGNVSEDNLEETLDGFKDKRGGGAPERTVPPIETAKPKPLVVEEKSGITQTYLCMGARTVNSSHKDTPALDLISTLLGGGTSSRLFTELREKYAVTYDVSSAHCKGIDFGYFSINCAVNNNKVDKTRALIFKELAKLREIDISPEELERVKQIMLGGVLRGMDNPHDCYEIITFMEMQHRSEYALKNYVEKIKAVTMSDIQDAANMYFAQDSFCSAIFNPLKSR